jgi:hypothetical protein
MDEYQVRTWEGWHHHMVLSLMAVWFLIGETHRGQQVTPALTLPQVRYGLSLLLLEVFYTPGVVSICRQVQRQLGPAGGNVRRDLIWWLRRPSVLPFLTFEPEIQAETD